MIDDSAPSDPLLDSLAENLRVFSAWDESNRAALAETKELLRLGARARDRRNYEPGHLTASAVVLSRDRSKLLLIRHRKLGLWLQPGGHLEASDETIVMAATRELVEETRLRSFEVASELFALDVHVIPAFGDNPSHRHFDVRVLFVAKDDDVGASDEVASVGWFPLHEVVNATSELSDGVKTDASVRALARRLLASEPRV